jgi:collagen type I/II/III/V/XI/XXIV/XXVII alpha
MAPRNLYPNIVSAAACGLAFSFAALAHADIPAGYAGKPFNPAVAGGPKCPPTVMAGPYTIPGRLDFVNYDLGGDGVAYHTGDHITKGGTGYRIDTPTATFSLTSDCIPNGAPGPCQNVWYDTSAALDGTPYPSATTADFSIGAVQDGDWVNITVNVETTGTYSLSSTWATGNGPPGGEGGNGDMGLEVFSNGTKLATWTAVFPNYNTEADFHHWMAYPNFATVTLAAGPQVIKLQSGAKHLQLDYVQFSLITGDGGLDDGEGGAGGGSGSTSSSGATGASGAAATSGGASGSTAAGGSTAATGGGTSGGAAGGSGSGAATGAAPSSGTTTSGSMTSSGTAGGTTGDTAPTGSGSSNATSSETGGASHASSCSASIDGRCVGGEGALAAALALMGVAEARRRRARSAR